MLVYYFYDDAGSAQDIHQYARAAKALGHEVILYGPRTASASFTCSKDIASADAAVFIFEWTTKLRDGDGLDLARLAAKIPRERRVVIDCDGHYNDAISIGGDYNHRDSGASRRWTEVCDSIADKICQPTMHPLRPNVRCFFFHAYDPAWQRPLEFGAKEFGMVYVGHSKFRWNPMERVLRAVEPIRSCVGRIGLVGHGWDGLPAWAGPMGIEDYYYTDQDYLRRLDVEVVPPVPVREVIPWMSRAVFNPVIYRPLFDHLRLVTCRTFETPAASTIPLLVLDAEYVEEIYGSAAGSLVLPLDRPEEKILDVMHNPEKYADDVLAVRRHMRERHSFEERVRQLLRIVNE